MTHLQKKTFLELKDEDFKNNGADFHELPQSVQEIENRLNTIESIIDVETLLQDVANESK